MPASVIQKIVRRILSVAEKPEDIPQLPADGMRVALMLVLQYYLMARITDLIQLEARDIALVDLDGERAVEVKFRRMKNDQTATGQISHILAEGGEACPYLLVQTYYARMGFWLYDEEHNDTNALFPRLRLLPGTRIQVSDGTFAVSVSTLLDDIKAACAGVGYEGRVTGKSAKISGVSDGFKAGMTDAEARDKGRWVGLETAQAYRRVSDSYRKKLAGYTSIQRAADRDRKQLATNAAVESKIVELWWLAEDTKVNVEGVEVEQVVETTMAIG